MCGILGFSGDYSFDPKWLEQAVDTLQHRGPDDRGIFLSPSEKVGLAHRRLAVIDLSLAGKQPMSNEKGDIWIVYNGEVYNFPELRPELESYGYRFRSHSDTEVIIYAYEKWGAECLSRFNGIFALAIWDSRQQRFFLARDRLGIKPLYYYQKGKNFVFASELKPFFSFPDFPRELDLKSLRKFLALNYIPAPETIFQGVEKLRPAHYLIWDKKTANLTVKRYWNPLDYIHRLDKSPLDFSTAEAELAERLESAVRYQLISDVPLGAFLSGGIDSSLITAIMQKVSSETVKSFTIGFREERYDEAGHARKVAESLGTNHHQRYLSWKEAQELVSRLPEFYSEPFADSSALPTYLLSRMAREKVTVVLSGDGGDELFGGYLRYRLLARLRHLQLIPGIFRRKIFATAGRCGNFELELYSGLCNFQELRELYEYIFVSWRPHELDRLFGERDSERYYFWREPFEHLPDLPPVTRAMLTDLGDYLPNDILTKVDRASMAVGLEARVPLLDHRLVEFVLGLPLEYKYKQGQHKYILREILSGFVPPELWERPKQGFGPPLNEWLKKELSGLVKTYLAPDRVKKEGIFLPKEVQRMVNLFNANRCSHYRIWSLLVFSLWAEHYRVI